jgi:type II secretory pathway pseudopilin PulG
VSEEARFPRGASGLTLLDLVVTLAVLAVATAVTVPPLLEATRRLRLDTAARQVARTFHLARSYAVRHSANVGVRFNPDTGGTGRVSWTLYRDGDGDGVSSEDVRRGVDPPIGPRERALTPFGRGVAFGFPPGDPPREVGGRGRLDRLDDPIRFNRSDIASFTSLGTATPGTAYLTDGRDGLMCVRVSSLSGRIRVLTYDAEKEEWR